MTEKQLKNSILQHAIQGKLVPQLQSEGTGEELLQQIEEEKKRQITQRNKEKIAKARSEGKTPAQIKKLKLEQYTPPKPITEKEQPFTLPTNWTWTRLGELFNHNTGKALNSSNKEGTMKDYLTTSNVYWNKFDFTVIKQMPFKESEMDKCSVTKGDLLVCEGGDIGRSAIWNYDYDICIQNHIHRLRSKIDLCVPFYYYTLAYLKGNNLIGGKGIGLLGLSSNALHNIEVPLPPLREQERIVAKVEEIFGLLNSVEAQI